MSAVIERPDIADHQALVRGKCREVLRHYAGYIDLEDLHQEVTLWWLTVDPEVLAQYVDEPRQLRLRRAVWRAARDAADRYRRQAGDHDPYVDVRYGVQELLTLLPVAMEPTGLPDGGGVREGPRAHNNLAEGGDLLAAVIDARRALEVLGDDDLDYLQFLRRSGWDYTLVGAALAIEADSARRRAARICGRMAAFLNGEDG